MTTVMPTGGTHNRWAKITAPTAKCDFCSMKNLVLVRCEVTACGITACRACVEKGLMEGEPHRLLREHVTLLDWTISRKPQASRARAQPARVTQATTENHPASSQEKMNTEAQAKSENTSSPLSAATDGNQEGSSKTGPPVGRLGRPRAFPSQMSGTFLASLVPTSEQHAAKQLPDATRYQSINPQGDSSYQPGSQQGANCNTVLTKNQALERGKSSADFFRVQENREVPPYRYALPLNKRFSEASSFVNDQAASADRSQAEQNKRQRFDSIPPEWLKGVDPELLANADKEMLDAALTLTFMKCGGFENGSNVSSGTPIVPNFKMNLTSFPTGIDAGELCKQYEHLAPRPAARPELSVNSGPLTSSAGGLTPAARPLLGSPFMAKPQQSSLSPQASQISRPFNVSAPQNIEQRDEKPDVSQWMDLMLLFGITNARWSEQEPNGKLTARTERLHTVWAQVMNYVTQRFPVDRMVPNMEVRFEFSWNKLLMQMGDCKPENELQRSVAQTAHSTIQQMLKNALEED